DDQRREVDTLISPRNISGRSEGGDSRKGPPVGFTMVETIVTLGVACILMIAVVAFLVNGVVSTTKTTAINDATTKGRYVFEHLSKEMSRASNLYLAPSPSPNFLLPNASPTPSAYASFNYWITVATGSISTSTQLSQ